MAKVQRGQLDPFAALQQIAAVTKPAEAGSGCTPDTRTATARQHAAARRWALANPSDQVDAALADYEANKDKAKSPCGLAAIRRRFVAGMIDLGFRPSIQSMPSTSSMPSIPAQWETARRYLCQHREDPGFAAILTLWDWCGRIPTSKATRAQLPAILLDLATKAGYVSPFSSPIQRSTFDVQRSTFAPSVPPSPSPIQRSTLDVRCSTFDLVIPLGSGSKTDDAELRYLLRSALANCPDLRRVHLITDHVPHWLGDHEQIWVHPWAPSGPKNHDIVAKFLYAANHPDVSETFLASCDDWAIVDQLTRSEFGAMRGRDLSDSTGNYWSRCQAETRKLLEEQGLPVAYYDTHTPSFMTKTGWHQVAGLDWRRTKHLAIWSLYHNVAGTHGPVLDTARATLWHSGNRAPESVQEIEDRTADEDSLFVAFHTAGFNDHARTWLEARFPTPAPWESPIAQASPPASSSSQATPSRRGYFPTHNDHQSPFTEDVLEALDAAGFPISPIDQPGYLQRFEDMLGQPHATQPLPLPGVVTLRENGNAHLGDNIAISQFPRHLHERGYTVWVEDTRSTRAVFTGNPFVAGFGRVGPEISPWFSRSERGHVIQRLHRALGFPIGAYPHGDLYLSADELAWAEQQRESWPQDKPVILLSTGCVSSRAAYLAVDWQALVDHVGQHATVVCPMVTSKDTHVGTRNGRWQHAHVADERLQGCIAYENLPTRQYMALMAVVDGAIGTMGGSCHVAAALGTPYVCVMPTIRYDGFDLEFPQLGRNGHCDTRWIYPQHLFSLPTEQPGGFPLTRDQVRRLMIHPSERDSVSQEQLSHIVSKYLIARQYKPRRIVEIGVRYGYSAAAFLLASPGATYQGFDIICHEDGSNGGRGNGEDTFPYVRSLLTVASTESHIKLTHRNSQSMLAFPEADFYHIDGDHTCQGALSDICKAFAACEPGGVILVDDYDNIAEVGAACRHFAEANASLIDHTRHVPSWRGEFIIIKSMQPVCKPTEAPLQEPCQAMT